jgi:hypothetical protein
MTKLYQRISKIQSTGDLVFEGTQQECEEHLHFLLNKTATSFLSQERNAKVLTADYLNLPIDDITPEMTQEPAIFFYAIDYFRDYFLLKSN